MPKQVTKINTVNKYFCLTYITDGASKQLYSLADLTIGKLVSVKIVDQNKSVVSCDLGNEIRGTCTRDLIEGQYQGSFFPLFANIGAGQGQCLSQRVLRGAHLCGLVLKIIRDLHLYKIVTRVLRDTCME